MGAFECVADPTRRRILDLLRAADRPAGEIADAFPVSRPAISRHLRVLRQAGLVHERRDGRRRVYRLDPAPLAEVDRWLDGYRTFWAARLMDLKEHIEGRPGLRSTP